MALEGVCKGKKVCKERRLDPIVGLDDCDVVAFGHIDAAVACCAVAFILLVYDPDPGVSCCMGLHDGESAIGRAVIQRQDLDVGIGLALDRGECRIKRALDIHARHDDRNLVMHASSSRRRQMHS